MVGNSYPYTHDDWVGDIEAAQSYGLDGFALNLGSDDWQPARIADAYAAACEVAAKDTTKPVFKLFLSFDMSILSDPGLINNYIREYHGNEAQFVYEGKDFVSTFSGEGVTFGQDNANDGWQIMVKDVLAGEGIQIYFVPAWTALPAQGIFQSHPVLDGIFSWAGWYATIVCQTDAGRLVMRT
jgi:glucan endo-1,3-alpha-glucosidase